ncbi:uncharacterized protein TRUGW13939_02054, partial [Talaromyces rugulosus]
VYYGTFPITSRKLHQKYGPVVRIAPNEYSIDDPNAAKVIYGSGNGYIKSPWYEASGNPMNPLPSLFDERNPRLHSAIRRKVSAAYSMSSLVQSESFVDDCTSLFQQRLSEFAQTGELVDLTHWYQCYAFDVIGNITFGNRFGFLDKGKDIQGIMASISGFLKYAARVGIFPEWHKYLFKLFIRSKNLNGMAHVRSFANENLEAHYTKLIQEMDPSKISKDEIALTCSTNIGAGSDTTSISLSATLYFLTLYPETLRKLHGEIGDMEAQNSLSNPVTFQESRSMPYLQTVIKEALRLHPATGLILGRVVPKGGTSLNGTWFPERSVVGVNPWVAHINTEIFGVDASEFRPERWLGDPEVVKKRESYFMSFWMGSRTCIGINISVMELSKIVPQLVRAFGFVPENGIPEWNTENVWFVKPKDFECRIKPHDGACIRKEGKKR